MSPALKQKISMYIDMYVNKYSHYEKEKHCFDYSCVTKYDKT